MSVEIQQSTNIVHFIMYSPNRSNKASVMHQFLQRFHTLAINSTRQTLVLIVHLELVSEGFPGWLEDLEVRNVISAKHTRFGVRWD